MQREGEGGEEHDARKGARHAKTELASYAAARASYRELDEVMLMDAMRRRDDRAIEEFMTRYQRLLNERVRQWRMSLDDAHDAIVELVDDMAVLIMSGRLNPKRSLSGYIVTSLRSRLAQQLKSDGSRSAAEDLAAVDANAHGERVIPSALSESTLRASRGPEWTSPSASLAMCRLVSMLDDEMSEEERRILDWLGNYISQRDICDWLGVSYTTGTQRIWRLRDRLREAVTRYESHFSFKERSELLHFFRRMYAGDTPPRTTEGGGKP